MRGQVESKDDPVTRVPDSELDYDEQLSYRWRGELFTGVGFDDSPSGLSEITYRHGVQEGPARDRYPSGILKGESWFREGVQHGTAREYDEDGRASSEAVYEYGILISRSERDQDGRLRQVYRLADDSPNSRLLERFRREKGWPQNVLASMSRLPAVLA